RASFFEAWQCPPSTQQRLLQRVLGVAVRAEHPVAVGLKLPPEGLDELTERIAIAGSRCPQQLPFARAPRGAGRCCCRIGMSGHRFGCQKAISPACAVETTLRQPAGPSRGSSSTLAPSRRARSVCSSIRSTSTYGSQSGRFVPHSTIPPPSPPPSSSAR